jgi:hypothetical protein
MYTGLSMVNQKDRSIEGKSVNYPHPSTSVENALQISSFLTNKPNSPNVQMSLNYLSTMDYAISTNLTKVKNKPNSKPISKAYDYGAASIP